MSRNILSLASITEPVAAELADAQADPAVRSALDTAYTDRRKAAEDLRLLGAYIPQLPDGDVSDTYERVRDYERQLVAPRLHSADYGGGTAAFPDDLEIAGKGSVLMEAQHATSPIRKETNQREAPDHGTAGLGYLLATEERGRIIIPRGLQNRNANVDATHPIKDAIHNELVRSPLPYQGFLSIHGCRPGKVTSLRDKSEIHGVIGLGLEPNDVSYEAAEQVVEQAASLYGLHVLIGNITPHLNFNTDPAWDGRSFWDLSEELQTKEDNPTELKAVRLAALMANSTTLFAAREMQHEQPDKPRPALQLEMSRSLRMMPEDLWRRPDPTAERVGVYLGVCLARLATDACMRSGS